MTACQIFINNFIDSEGKSDIIFITDLVASFGKQFESNNGCQWARKGSLLDKKYILVRYNAKSLSIADAPWNRIVAIQTLGFRKSIENHFIPSIVRNNLKGKPCSVLGVLTNDLEIDHKNGKYNQEQYQMKDFQVLSKAVNDAKREHCKKCNATGQRFKASILGYSVDFIKGEATSQYCEGCYWYDPCYFNKVVSQKYKE